MIASGNSPVYDRRTPKQDEREIWDMRKGEAIKNPETQEYEYKPYPERGIGDFIQSIFKDEDNQDTLRLIHNVINPVGEISEDNTFTPQDPATLLGAGGILDLLGRKAGKSAKLMKKLVRPSANTNVKNIPIKNMSPDSQDIPIWRVHNTPSPKKADYSPSWPPSLPWNKKTKSIQDKGTLWAQDKMSNKDFKKYLKGQGYDVDLRQKDFGYLEIYDRISGKGYKLDL